MYISIGKVYKIISQAEHGICTKRSDSPKYKQTPVISLKLEYVSKQQKSQRQGEKTTFHTVIKEFCYPENINFQLKLQDGE